VQLAAVFFDVTGTLIELRESVGVTYARVAARHGVRVPAHPLGKTFGRVMESAPPRIFPGRSPEQIRKAEHNWWRERVRETFESAGTGIRFGDFDAFFSELFELYAGAHAWRLRPDALPALARVAGLGLHSGVISNFDYRLPRVLQDLEIQGFMDVVLFPAGCAAAKPSPTIFRAAESALGLRAGQCAYVGHDPSLDIAAAHAAGWHGIDAGSGLDSRTLSARIEWLAKLLS
jgi:putative hydrolase of the HAD superfamily